MKFIESIENLEEIYGLPSEAALKKVTNIIIPAYRTWIEKSSFCLISSVGSDGTDVSPRGDDGPVVKILNNKTIALPDWKGNQRVDTLRNIIEDERVSLLFMISGSNNVIRVNGKAKITTDEELMSLFVKKERYPKAIIVIEAVDVYFQCARALMRSKLWEDKVEDLDLPTPGLILKEITNASFDAEAYDSSWPERYKKSLW